MTKNIFENLQTRIYCFLCDREMTAHSYISCFECENTHICIICFSMGLENGDHKAYHRYSVISRMNIPLFTPTWTIQEELTLIEALEKFGYGNWIEIARYIKNKTDDDVEDHFLTFYFNSNLFNPEFAGKTGEPPQEMAIYQEYPTEIVPEKFQKLSDRIRENLAPSFKIAKEKSEKYGINLADKTGYGQVIGYMPLRKEFEVEYNNDAELYIADMEFSPDDSEMEYKTKLCILEIYYARLQEREEKKNFVIEHDLIDINEVLNRERRMTEEERAIRNSTRDKMPFLTKEEYEDLIQCYLNEINFERFQNDFIEMEKYNIKNLQEFEDLIFNEQLRRQNKEELDSQIKTLETEKETKTLKKRNKFKQNSILDAKSAQDKLMVEASETPGIIKEELDFCLGNQISFDFYLVVKEYFIRECYARGSVKKEELTSVCNSGFPQIGFIFDFLAKQKLLVLENE